MTDYAPADDLAAGYEALRAVAVGSLPTDSPRGLTLVLAQGLPGWIHAWTKPPPSRFPVPAGARTAQTTGLGAEVVALLTEMALGHQRRLASP